MFQAYTTQQYYNPYYYNPYYQQPYYQQPYYQQVPSATTNHQQPQAPTAISTQTPGASSNTVAPAAAQSPQAPVEAPQPASGPNETPNLPEIPVENTAVTPAPEAGARSSLVYSNHQPNFQLFERNGPLKPFSYKAALSARSNLGNVLLEPQEHQGNARPAFWQQLENPAAARSALITFLQEPAIAGQELSSQLRNVNVQNARSPILNQANRRFRQAKTLLGQVPLSTNFKYDSDINSGSQYSVKADTPYPEKYQFYDNRLSPISYDDLSENEFAEADEYFSPSLTRYV